MFSKLNQSSKENKINNIDTIIGQGTLISGTLSSASSVRVDGEWQGDINVEGTLTVGHSGKIEGQVTAKNVFIEGSVVGNIITEEHLHLSSTAKVNGDIHSSSLEIESGARFEGKSSMHKDKQTSPSSKVINKQQETQQAIS